MRFERVFHPYQAHWASLSCRLQGRVGYLQTPKSEIESVKRILAERVHAHPAAAGTDCPLYVPPVTPRAMETRVD